MSGIPMLIPKWILKKIGFTGTKSEVQAAISSGRIKDGDTVTITDDSADELTALSVSYDNTTSGMSATSVQGAVDELNNDLTNIEYNLIKVPFTTSQTWSTIFQNIYTAVGDTYDDCKVVIDVSPFYSIPVKGIISTSFTTSLCNFTGVQGGIRFFSYTSNSHKLYLIQIDTAGTNISDFTNNNPSANGTAYVYVRNETR